MASTKKQDFQRIILQRLFYRTEQTNRQLAEYIQDRLHSHIEQGLREEFGYEAYEEFYVEDIKKIVHDVSNETKELLEQKILQKEHIEVQEHYKNSSKKITRVAYHIPKKIPFLKRLFEKIDIYYKEGFVWDIILFLNSPYLKELAPRLVSKLLSKAVSLFYYKIESPSITEIEKAKIELLVRMSFTNLKWILSSFEIDENENVTIINPSILQPASKLWNFQEKKEIPRKLKRSEVGAQFKDMPRREIAEILEEDEKGFRREISIYIYDLLVNVKADRARLFKDIMRSGDFRLLSPYFGEDIHSRFVELFGAHEITFTAHFALQGPNPNIPASEWE